MKGSFIGDKNFSVIKVHGTTIKKYCHAEGFLYVQADSPL